MRHQRRSAPPEPLGLLMTDPGRTAAVILAAGDATRFGAANNLGHATVKLGAIDFENHVL